MRILITGGAGFIGSNLADYLFDQGHELIVVDDFSTGKASNLIRLHSKISIISASIEDVDLNEYASLDAVVHLAAQASVPLSITNFKDSSTTNILGTIHVIDHCSKNGVPLVFASSSAIYGDLPLGDDEAGAIDLLSPYAADKYAMEVYAMTAHNVYNLSTVGLRFFNVYGPRQDPSSPYSGVISIFADRLLKDQSITINGGHQTRDFVFVKDVVVCIAKSIDLAMSQPTCEMLNVLTGRSVTIDEIADQIGCEVGGVAEKVYQALPPGDPVASQGASNKLINTLGIDISSFKEIETGLKETVQFIRDDASDE